MEQWEEPPQNEYAVFSRVVRPYIEDLMTNGDKSGLKQIWDALEHIAKNWGDPASNEIFVVTTEEIELHKHYQYLGPTLIERWVTSTTWYPTFNNKCAPINRHIDKQAYRKRWLKSIGISIIVSHVG